MNLVLNAAKFTPAGGQIVVRVQPDREFAVLRVIDNGDGIDKTLYTTPQQPENPAKWPPDPYDKPFVSLIL